jgi:DNA repair exonuclease SbcCD ATPase subunit
MKMKTRKNFKISFTIMILLIAGLFISCQQGERIDEKVQNQVEDLRDDLNDLSEDDSNFADNLHGELEEFEESMNDIKEEMNESDEQISMEIRQAVNDLQAESRSLRMKLERRTQAGDDDSGLMGDMRDNDDRDYDDAVNGDRTVQAQRDTSLTDTMGTDERMYTENESSMHTIDQEIRAEFQNFRQNVNQWVDRLSASTGEDRNDYE